MSIGVCQNILSNSLLILPFLAHSCRYIFFLDIYMEILTTINFLNCTQNSIFIKHILNYSIYKIFGSYFWLWALTFFSFHLNILYFWISILKPILWFLVLVLGKIFLLTHFILAFLARLIFKPWHSFYALEYLVRSFSIMYHE